MRQARILIALALLGAMMTPASAQYVGNRASSAPDATKANLAGGNSFTGNQTVAGNLTATGSTYLFGPQSGGAADTLVYFDNTNAKDILYFRSWSAGSPTYDGGIQSFRSVGMDLTGNSAIRFFSGSSLSGATQSGQIDASALTLSSGITLKSNTTTILNGSGVLQAAGFPALTGDVTNSAGSLGTTIAAGAVTTTKMASIAANTVLANATASSASPTAVAVGASQFLCRGSSGDIVACSVGPSLSIATGTLKRSALTGDVTASIDSNATTLGTVAGAILTSGATAGVGYATGAGGAVTQITSRATGVTNNKACGAITMFSAAGSATWATFTVTDSAVAATDTIIANQKSGTNLYMLAVTAIGSGTFNLSFATTGGTATDAPVINYCVIKGVAA